jgi:alcohol dehydrogenase class IV
LSATESAFIWDDAGRAVHFGEGALEQMPDSGFELFTTARALADTQLGVEAPRHEVAPGAVPESAAALLGRVSAPTIVALGGGRVIDTAKAVAAVEGQDVVAIPTTLSGAEMTAIHRLPARGEARALGLVRPSRVLADPELMTGLPEPQLRASAMNALAHGADSLYTPYANPVSRMTALQGAGLIAETLDQERERRDRAGLALAAILSGYAIDSGKFAIHHVICQTLVRELGIPHADTNAAILPQAMGFMRERAPEQIAALAQVLGTDPARLPARIAELGRPRGLGELGADRERLEAALDAVQERPDLALTPRPPDRGELRAIVEAAW